MNTAKRSVTVRLSEEDVAFLVRTAQKHALPGEKPNLSRAARIIIKKARAK